MKKRQNDRDMGQLKYPKKSFSSNVVPRKTAYELTWDWNKSSVIIGRRLAS